MSKSHLFALILLGAVAAIQVIVYLVKYYKQKNPLYKKVYKFLQQVSKDLDNDRGYVTLTDVRYILMSKYGLSALDSIDCMKHMHDETDEWFKNNIN